MPHLPITHEIENELLNVNGITSVGRGLINGQDAIIIGIESGDMESQIQQLVEQQFGTTIQGNQYEIRVTGQFVPQQITVPREIQASIDPQRTGRFRPVPMGVSIGHENITAGSSGFLLTDGDNIFTSSNNHVLAQANEGNIGDDILQPGPVDGGTQSDKVGELENYIALEQNVTVDMAWATPVNTEFSIIMQGIDQDVLSDIIIPEPGDTLIKTGRTTGVTTGLVDQVAASVNINYGGSIGVITLQDQIVASDMSQGGDSGSPAFIQGENGLHPAGCIFAGSDQTSVLNTAENWINESGLDILPVGDVIGAGFSTDELVGFGIGGAIGGAILHDVLL